jgi:hypothetical protein
MARGMKAILEFNLPEEQEEHRLALNGCKYNCVIIDTLNHIRSKLKYQNLPTKTQKIYEELREFILSELDGIDL